MAEAAYRLKYTRRRLRQRDPNFTHIHIFDKRVTDSKISKIVTLLLNDPDTVTEINLSYNLLTHETGAKLAQLVAKSSTLRSLILWNNNFTDETYLAMAAALRVNSSLRVLELGDNRPIEDRDRVDAAFIEALRHNPHRPQMTIWSLQEDIHAFNRYSLEAKELGPPSMLSYLDFSEAETN